MNVFVIGLTIFLIISLLIDAYFHYKHAQLLQKRLDFDLKNLRQKSVSQEFTEILKNQWLNYQKDHRPFAEKSFAQWTANELAKRLESEFIKPISSESDTALHGHYQEYLAICQSEKKPMLSFTHWKAQLGKEAANV